MELKNVMGSKALILGKQEKAQRLPTPLTHESNASDFQQDHILNALWRCSGTLCSFYQKV